MRMARAGIPAALILGALALSAPAAMAAEEDEGRISISERRAAPGTTVTVTTNACGDETYGKGESEAGGQFHLLESDEEGVLKGEFTVPDDADSGSDTVTLKCPPRTKVTGTYEISGRPNGAVDAGFGATDNTTQLALGGVLVTGAVAGTVVRMRRRPSGVSA